MALARKRGLYSDTLLFAGDPEFLVMPPIMGPVCLISHTGPV